VVEEEIDASPHRLRLPLRSCGPFVPHLPPPRRGRTRRLGRAGVARRVRQGPRDRVAPEPSLPRLGADPVGRTTHGRRQV